jgi:hypothetical protein
MVISNYMKMLISSESGWRELEKIHPKVSSMFIFLVLPMSLVPPAMIAFAGSSYGSSYFEHANPGMWISSALIFLFAQLFTVPLMALTIQSIAESRNIKTEFHKTFSIAAIAAVPMWLSSVALFVHSPLFVISMALVGLIAAISLMYHGIEGLLHMHEEVEVAAITHTTISTGVVVWTMLIALVFLPLLI